MVKTGKICVLDIDMQGVKSVKKTDLNPRYIFIQPPSLEALEKRLKGRGTESDESLAKRLSAANAELTYGEETGCDYRAGGLGFHMGNKRTFKPNFYLVVRL